MSEASHWIPALVLPDIHVADIAHNVHTRIIAAPWNTRFMTRGVYTRCPVAPDHTGARKTITTTATFTTFTTKT